MAFESMRSAITSANNKRSGGGSAPTITSLSFITWKDKDSKIIRLLDDDPKPFDSSWVLCFDGVQRNFLIDSHKEDYIAKYASREPGVGWSRNPATKQMEPHVVRSSGFGVAVLREEVPDGNGRTKIIDAMRTVETGGSTYTGRTFGILQQSLGNFWDQFDGYQRRYGTLVDRDYLVERTGSGFDTKYTIIPIDPVEGLRTAEEVHAEYGYGRPYPKRPGDDASAAEIRDWEDRFLYCSTTLDQWLDITSGEDRVKRLMVGDGSAPAVPDRGESLGEFRPSGFGSSSSDEAQVVADGNTDFASLKKKILENR